jgi:hypothetical protein
LGWALLAWRKYQGEGERKRQTWKRRKKEVRKVGDEKNLIRGSNKR